MLVLIVRLLLLLSIISTICSLSLSCYLNARLNFLSSGIVYSSLTLRSCQCLMIEQAMLGFQYDSTNNSCYTFADDSLRSNLRVKINCQVCFIARTSTSHLMTTSVMTMLPSAPITTSTLVSGNNYYTTESIYLNNNIILTSLSILITVQKTVGLYGPTLYTNFWSNTINEVINDTSDSVMYSYTLINGRTIVTGQWEITAQFSLNGQVRPTSNDTYIIQILSYQDIVGHF